ncbi:MAG: hypothetical protein HYX68_06425 [Planctomycetes bacterium]|nr:hypothetical protein [Planctomycetota bacterium]
MDFHNRTASEVAGIRRRRLLTGILLGVFIALMPCGFAVPCGLGIALKHIQPMFTVFGVTAVFLPVIGLGGTILMMLDRSRYARSWAIAQFAVENQYSFVYTPEVELFGFLDQIQVFSEGNTSSAANFIQGKYKKRAFTLMDYSYQVGFGQYSSAYTQTVVVLHDAVEGAPNFVLSPRGWLDRFSEMFGGKSIEVPDAKQFNKAFVLAGMRPSDIAARFDSDELLELCLEDPTLAMEAYRGDLIVFRDNRLLHARDYKDFLDRAMMMARLLRRTE